MTPAQLRAALETLLTGHVGTYTTPAGDAKPAIRLGEPPSTWEATGVEVRVDAGPEYANRGLHSHTAIAREYAVRVIAHGSGDAAAVVERICQRFETSNPAHVPASERLGILAQYTLRIRS